jgi:uncharacterized membrane protein|tara:strand:+ start:622 stop:975 length:354 start_codon:yes stop_codon:yes gene_type:complete
MNQILPNTPLSTQDDEAKTHALIAYALMLTGLLTVVFWLVGGIWAMVKKSDTEGSRFADHYNNLISTFWWAIFWAVLGGILSLFFIGYIMLGILWLWALYRLIKGLAKLTSNRAYES